MLFSRNQKFRGKSIVNWSVLNDRFVLVGVIVSHFVWEFVVGKKRRATCCLEVFQKREYASSWRESSYICTDLSFQYGEVVAEYDIYHKLISSTRENKTKKKSLDYTWKLT